MQTPTEPGWYWWRPCEFWMWACAVVSADPHDGHLCALPYPWTHPQELECLAGEWGPRIPEPGQLVTLRELVRELRRADLGLCPICQEFTCDGSCPMALLGILPSPNTLGDETPLWTEEEEDADSD